MSAIITNGFHKDLIFVDQAKLDAMSTIDLIELAKETNGKTLKSAKQTLLHAGQTGILLIALKRKSEHGSFMANVEHTIGINHRTASNYMAIAHNYGSVSSLRGVSDAIRYIREASTNAKIQNRNVSNLPPAPSTPRSPLPMGAVECDAEMVEPAPAIESVSPDENDEEDMEPLVVDESKTAPAPKEKNPIIKYGVSVINKTKDAPIDPTEPLFIAIKHGNPEAKTEPIFDAIERLIFVLIVYKKTDSYINDLADSVLATEGKTP